MIKNIKLDGRTLTGSELTMAYVVFGFGALLLLLSLGIAIMWVYYSWIRRNNSKNYTGKEISEFIFKKAGMNPEIKSSFFYVKYWNLNKRKNTYRLRPWTMNRRSIWTMMEASQQAYASTIRETKGKTFWLIFRLPVILRVAGALVSALFIYLGLKTFDGGISNMNTKTWLLFSVAISVLLISYTIADVGKVYVLWKNIVPLLKDSGLDEKELKAINRIYFWRMVYAIVVVILEVIKLVVQLLNSKNANNNN